MPGHESLWASAPLDGRPREMSTSSGEAQRGDRQSPRCISRSLVRTVIAASLSSGIWKYLAVGGNAGMSWEGFVFFVFFTLLDGDRSVCGEGSSAVSLPKL